MTEIVASADPQNRCSHPANAKAPDWGTDVCYFPPQLAGAGARRRCGRGCGLEARAREGGVARGAAAVGDEGRDGGGLAGTAEQGEANHSEERGGSRREGRGFDAGVVFLRSGAYICSGVDKFQYGRYCSALLFSSVYDAFACTSPVCMSQFTSFENLVLSYVTELNGTVREY